MPQTTKQPVQLAGDPSCLAPRDRVSVRQLKDIQYPWEGRELCCSLHEPKFTSRCSAAGCVALTDACRLPLVITMVRSSKCPPAQGVEAKDLGRWADSWQKILESNMLSFKDWTMDTYRRPRTARAMQLKWNDIVSGLLDSVWRPRLRILRKTDKENGSPDPWFLRICNGVNENAIADVL